MLAQEPNRFCICESRYEAMVDPCSKEEAVNSTMKLARFLKPCANTINQVPSFPIPKPSEKPKHLNAKVNFKGWKRPQRKWGDWFETLTGKHAYTWNQTGLCDALLSSLYEVRRNPRLILGLVEYWCPQNNTFVFPWGEATITLEDVMVIGGYSVLGKPVNLPLSENLLEIEAKLVEIRGKMWKTKSKKADHSTWMKLFMEENESDELEHVGFLSLWLSRFVFPSLPESTIGTNVFPIAIHLSQGTKLALAPAVLATIYHNLSLLKEQVVSSMEESLTVQGQFQLVLQWAFERFPILGPKFPKELKPGEPRTARWHKLNSDASDSLISSAFKSGENFQWRPFAADLKNWCFVSPYKDNELFVVDGLNSSEESMSFGLCLCSDEHEGLNCTEKYMPYRVAMQFGMDLHLPGEFTITQPNCMESFSFYVPAKCYKPCVSLEYHNWWQKNSKIIQGKEILKDDSNLSSLMSDVLMVEKQHCEEGNQSSTTSNENGSKRKFSTIEQIKEVESNSFLKNTTCCFSGLNNVITIGNSNGMLSEKGKGKQHGEGTCVSLEYHNWWQKNSMIIQGKEILKLEKRKEDDSVLLTTSNENGSNGRLSTREQSEEVKSNNISISFLKNATSCFLGLNNVITIGNSKGMLSEEGKGKQHGEGTYDNPLDAEDYVCNTSLGTSSNPIDIDDYM